MRCTPDALRAVDEVEQLRFASRVLSTFSLILCSVMLERVSDVTRILDRVQQGDPKAAAELLPLIYDELRRPAARAGSRSVAAGCQVRDSVMKLANNRLE